MVSRLKKIIIIMSIIILSVLIINQHNGAKNNDGNIEIIKLNQDKLYLENLNNIDRIRQEMDGLNLSIKALEQDYVLSKKGIKVFPGNNSLENNMLRTKLFNRSRKLELLENFKYDTRGRYLQARGNVKDLGFDGYFSQEEMDRSLEAIVQVLDNLDMDLDFLKTTKFVVSPYKIKSSNGYAVIRSNNTNTIVIANRASGGPNYMEEIQSTVLHEIGHVFGRDIVGEEDAIYCQACSPDQAWEASMVETFAEEFRILASARLGDKSFKPYGNKTKQGLKGPELERLKTKMKAGK